MNVEEAIQNRRSIRNYLAKEVEKEKVEALIESARLCQSAKNRQPWKFMILQGSKKDKIATIMLEIAKEEKEHPKGNLGYKNSSANSANVIKKAPLLILVFRQKEEYWNIGDLLSIGASIENMALRAVELGLGTLWIRDTVYAQKEIEKEVKKEELDLVCGLTVGYPNEFPSPRPRKELKEIML